ncbi:hypothetical protein RFI_07263 [Reticulomyxa filosa]|uniref:Deacetylase sirtuin-type domain-containing protein n=1 Tax=Reticulomyxa filosa TaxID=46433 RepID=X6NVF1_RETFI|nr:hypothetical protein RFI_07263 [Reticulomyxa filosa]|eukprot:ETO29858.1 hypothetical protein RFI_07263 [Reticulomyxa filosa]
MKKEIPYCPYCCPNKSKLGHTRRDSKDVMDLVFDEEVEITKDKDEESKKEKKEENKEQTTGDNGDPTQMKLEESKAIIEEFDGVLNEIRVRVPKLLQTQLMTGVYVLRQYDRHVLQYTWLPYQPSDKFRELQVHCDDPMILNHCKEGIHNWFKSLPSFGVFKPDIVFFSEPLSNDYYQTLEKDKALCDLVLILGTSLQGMSVYNCIHLCGKVVKEKHSHVLYLSLEIKEEVPMVLINRQVVGFPNAFDVHLLGDCDDVCETLMNLLGWGIRCPIKSSDKKPTSDTFSKIISRGRHEITPILTENSLLILVFFFYNKTIIISFFF